MSRTLGPYPTFPDTCAQVREECVPAIDPTLQGKARRLFGGLSLYSFQSSPWKHSFGSYARQERFATLGMCERD